jgi:integrase
MAVYDRWHRDPLPGDEPCKCGTRRTPLYPSSAHLSGDRWQVRWRDLANRQKKRNFTLKVGTDPARHADAFDAKVSRDLDTRVYVDPKSAEVSLREYAERWRKGREIPEHDTAADLEARLRNHVYEGERGSGRTPRKGIAIGQHSMGLLAAQPSIVAAWAAAVPLAPSRRRHVMNDVSAVFRTAMDDGIVHRDPTRAQAVEWPSAKGAHARAWSLAQVEAMRAELPERWHVLLDLGAGTGMRQGEMLGLGVDDVDWLKPGDPRVRVVRQLRYIAGKPWFKPLKNEKKHSPPLSPELKRRLAARLERFPAREVSLPWYDPADRDRHEKLITVRLIVTSERGGPVERHALSNAWRRAAVRAGVTPEGERVRDDGCHALRHTAASTWLRSGIDLVRVAAWLGDTPAMVLDAYAHYVPGHDDNDGRAATDAFFAGPCAPDVPSEGEGGESVQGNG